MSRQRHPAWVLHAHGDRGGITDKALRRAYICFEIGINERDTLKHLSLEQIKAGDDVLSRLSNEEIARRFSSWRYHRAARRYSPEELLVLQTEFENEHPQAGEFGMTLTEYLETRVAA